jgi:RNA methyltransferase, TrmH family
MQRIASPQNPLLKDIRKAMQRGTLTDTGYAVCETFHLLEEAIRSDCEVPAVVTSESAQTAVERILQDRRGVRFNVVDDTLFDQIASTETSQGVIALVKAPSWTFEQLLDGRTMVVLLDGVQDPGNAGTIVRAAEAFGATGVAFLKGSVSPFNTKTLRAASGSLFRLPFVYSVDPGFVCEAVVHDGLELYAAVPGATRPLHEVNLSRRCALAIGSEAHGVSDKLKKASREMCIPTTGVESLNAAMAASIILYEASRQRRLAGDAS